MTTTAMQPPAAGKPAAGRSPRTRPPGWAIVAASVPMFMVALDNLVVTTALTAIRVDLGASVQSLGWIVNAYVLAFAGLLLTGAALGDRFGRRRMFVVGVVVFTAASVGCGLADSAGTLIAGRIAQGVGAAAVMPLSLTLLARAVPESKRNLAIGLWSGINGLAIALGPLVGGAVVEGIHWSWIFWLNLPIGVVAVPLALRALDESHGPDRQLDPLGMVLGSSAVLAAVWGIVHAHEQGWTDGRILAAFGAAGALGAAFVWWERRVAHPLLPLGFYRIRAFTLTNAVSAGMYFGVFGSIFLLAQYLQAGLGYSPLAAGLRTLPWTLAPMVVAPIAGLVTDRVGGGRLMALGLTLQGFGLGWIATVAAPGIPYGNLVPPLVISGVGMGLVYAPAASVVLGAVLPSQHGKASGANTTVRELGGALGIAVLSTVLLRYGGTGTPEAFTAGLAPAVWVGVAVVLCSAAVALAIPHRRPRRALEPTPEPSAAPQPP